MTLQKICPFLIPVVEAVSVSESIQSTELNTVMAQLGLILSLYPKKSEMVD
jgi:hypothetical protein